MHEMPPAVLEGLNDTDRERSLSWWDSLPGPARADFAQMWDERSEDTTIYGAIEGDRLTWHTLPIELVGIPVDQDTASLEREHDEIKQQLLEYINNQNIDFFLFKGRTFHICRAHVDARQVVRDGLLPANFTCPLRSQTCPMLRILAAAEGKSIALQPRFCRHE